jgi:subtilase family serine protease
MQYYVVSGKTVHVMVKVTNAGSGDAGSFVVKWMANQDLGGCHWTMSRLAAGKSKDLECEYTYTWSASKYTSTLFVDSDGSVTESNESNNKRYDDVKLH